MSKLRILPSDSYKSLNAWILYVALPALSLRYVPEIVWGFHILLSVTGPLVVWVGAWIFIQLYDWKRRLSLSSRTALLITCGLGNTAFIGYPMISAYYGESEIQHAVVFDQITFVLFATVGVVTVLSASAQKANKINPIYIIKKVFRFPPFLACLLALILPLFINISPLNPLLDKLIATMSPIALFSIGLQLKLGELKKEWRMISAGIVYKLLLAPFLVLILALILQSSSDLAKISVFEAGMSSHITASLLATQYNMNPRYCSMVVGLGIILSFLSLTLWYFILNKVFS